MMMFRPDRMKFLISSILTYLESPKNHAEIVADHLVQANLLGFDSHGVIRVPQYVKEIQDGYIKPKTKIRVVKQTETTAIVDVGWNFGQVGAKYATEIVIKKAKNAGIAFAIVNHSNHVGCASIYTRLAAENGLLAIAYCGSPGNGHFVCPFQGAEGRLSPGPLSYAIPTLSDPIVADFSTSAVAEGKIRLMRNRKEKLEQDWALDSNGNPITNPEDFYGPKMGVVLPFGGKQGYKGYALGILTQVLSTQLGGVNWRPNLSDSRGNSMSIMAIDINNFVPIQEFMKEMSEYAKYLKSAKPATDFKEVLLPGELEHRSIQKRNGEGIPIDDTTWNQIATIGNMVGLQTKIIEDTKTNLY